MGQPPMSFIRFSYAWPTLRHSDLGGWSSALLQSPGWIQMDLCPFLEKPNAATTAALVINKNAVSSPIKTIFTLFSYVIYLLSEHTARIISLG